MRKVHYDAVFNRRIKERLSTSSKVKLMERMYRLDQLKHQVNPAKI